eukprot:GHVS01095811.1.p1 GENE.GHVS01095811.1~~GHVS01095811.1.p1  ORF type:complete len:898 (+),score=250.33 GHVS01095811.1:68-2761(+)
MLHVFSSPSWPSLGQQHQREPGEGGGDEWRETEEEEPCPNVEPPFCSLASVVSSPPSTLLSSSSSSSSIQSSLRVLVRIRPFISSESPSSCLQLGPNEQPNGRRGLVLADPRHRGTSRTYSSLDEVYGPETSNADIFSQEILPKLHLLFSKSKSTTIVCCGASGTGKTYTLQGPSCGGDVASNANCLNTSAVVRVGEEEEPSGAAAAGGLGSGGLVQMSVEEIVKLYVESNGHQNNESTNGEHDSGYSLHCSFFEIYNEKVKDLLASAKRKKEGVDVAAAASAALAAGSQILQMREGGTGRVVVAGLSEKEFTTMEQFEQFYRRGLMRRKTAQTRVNEDSSRSHSCLQIRIEKNLPHAPSAPTRSGGRGLSSMSFHAPQKHQMSGKLTVMDLAGVENNRVADNRGKRVEESGHINNSLFVLSKVISALRRGSSRIPYRDSKLTRLLQDRLCVGECSVLICTVSPAVSFFQQTYNTLNFASDSKSLTVVTSATCGISADTSSSTPEQQLEGERKAKPSAETNSCSRVGGSVHTGRSEEGEDQRRRTKGSSRGGGRKATLELSCHEDVRDNNVKSVSPTRNKRFGEVDSSPVPPALSPPPPLSPKLRSLPLPPPSHRRPPASSSPPHSIGRSPSPLERVPTGSPVRTPLGSSVAPVRTAASCIPVAKTRDGGGGGSKSGGGGGGGGGKMSKANVGWGKKQDGSGLKSSGRDAAATMASSNTSGGKMNSLTVGGDGDNTCGKVHPKVGVENSSLSSSSLSSPSSSSSLNVVDNFLCSQFDNIEFRFNQTMSKDAAAVRTLSLPLLRYLVLGVVAYDHIPQLQEKEAAHLQKSLAEWQPAEDASAGSRSFPLSSPPPHLCRYEQDDVVVVRRKEEGRNLGNDEDDTYESDQEDELSDSNHC